MPLTRRRLLGKAAALAAAAQAEAQTTARPASQSRPNIVFIISDQFRADALGCMGRNPMNLTPNLDAMAKHGTLFRNAMTNQPVCAPARGTMMTGQYPAKHGVWKNALGLKPDAVTLPRVLRAAGYTASFIGKWHLSGDPAPGAVAPAERGGFDDFWEGANALERTSHSFEGEMYDGDGKPVRFEGEYRADFITRRTVRFLKEKRQKDRPFLLMVSYLEVHHQNDIDEFVPPVQYAKDYRNAWAPQDLRPYPGNWASQLPGYYGSVKSIDDNVGTLLKTLRDEGIADNTIVLFTSDHGCHFKTRNAEYKRSPHDASINVPLIVQGPNFNRSLEISELVSHVDLMPSLLEACGIAKPPGLQGNSVLPLLDRKADGWRNEVYIEISESLAGRALRTPQWTYAVAAPDSAKQSSHYNEYILYDNLADPFQHVNLAGRVETRAISSGLRERLLARMAEAGDSKAVIDPPFIPYV